MSNLVNVAVIGSGPAGSAAALLLAKSQISTLLIDRSHDTGWKIGEGLPPSARPLLQKLGVWERFVEDGHLPSYGNRSAWGSQKLVDYDFIFDPNGAGWHLDRRRFDAMLASVAVQAGAVRRCRTQVVNWRRNHRGGWQLDLLSEGQRAQIDADLIIDATGRTSWFAKRQLGNRQHYDRLVGVVALLAPASSSTDNNSLTLIEAVQEGWWYSALLPSRKLVVAYMSDADLVATKRLQTVDGWTAQLMQTEHIQHRVESHGYRLEVVPHIISANSSRLSKMVGESWLAVGDAAAAYDPLSSQGIVTAIATGLQAATSIQAYLNGKQDALEKYTEHIELMYANYLANRTAYYALEQRWSTSLFWQRRFVNPLTSLVKSF